MNPYEVHGPQFLLLYIAAVFISILLAFLVREVVRNLGLGRYQRSLKLHPYEIAYLNGGDDLALKSILGYLVLKGVARIEGADSNAMLVFNDDSLAKMQQAREEDREFHRHADEVINELENIIVNVAGHRNWNQIQGHKKSLKKYFSQIRRKLEKNHLMVSSQKEKQIRIMMMLAVLLPPLALAIPRFIEVFSTNKPVMFLFVLFIVSFVPIWIIKNLPSIRTANGDKYLAELKEKHSGLYETANAGTENLKPEDMALAVSVFGPLMFLSTSFSSLGTFLAPQTAIGGQLQGSREVSSCSSCSGFGGCGGCGGGCGGCGGGCGG